MTVAFVKDAENQSANGTTVVSCTLSSAPASGNLVVVCVAWDKDFGTASVTSGGTWTEEVELDNSSTALFVAWAVADGTSTYTTVEVTGVNSAPSGASIWYGEFEDSAVGGSTWELVAKATNPSTGSSVDSTSSGTTSSIANPGMAIAAFSIDSIGSSGRTVTFTNSFTEEGNSAADSGAGGIFVGTKSVTSGTVETVCDPSGSSDQMHGAVIVMRKVGATGTDYTRDGFDALGLTDSGAVASTFNRTQADDLGLTDSVAWQGSSWMTWGNASALTWGQAGFRKWHPFTEIPLSLAAESFGLTDSASVAVSKIKELTDNLGLADAAIVGLTVNRNFADSFGFTDSVVVSLGVGRNLSDSLGLTDSATIEKALTRNFTDSLGLADSATVAWSDNQLHTENFGLTDSVAFDRSMLRVESFTLSDTAAFETRKLRVDSLDFTDSATIELAKALGLSDSFGITDASLVEVAFSRNLSEALGMSDSVVFDRAMLRTEAFGLSDSVALDQSKKFEDSLGLTDSATVSVPTVRNFSDSLGLTDSATVLLIENSLGLAVSRVDDARTAIKNMLGLTDAQVAILSINDLLHKYWSADFPVSHTYDGSESTFSPVEAYSILDHKTEVGVNLHWLKDVTET